jgi:hypothetical protein
MNLKGFLPFFPAAELAPPLAGVYVSLGDMHIELPASLFSWQETGEPVFLGSGICGGNPTLP